MKETGTFLVVCCVCSCGDGDNEKELDTGTGLRFSCKSNKAQQAIGRITNNGSPRGNGNTNRSYTAYVMD